MEEASACVGRGVYVYRSRMPENSRPTRHGVRQVSRDRPRTSRSRRNDPLTSDRSWRMDSFVRWVGSTAACIASLVGVVIVSNWEDRGYLLLSAVVFGVMAAWMWRSFRP